MKQRHRSLPDNLKRSVGVLAVIAALSVLLVTPAQLQASVVVFPQDLAGFNIAAGTPPITINFDTVAAGTDVTGSIIAGVTFQGPRSPLIVVRGADTFTPLGFAGDPVTDLNKLYATSGENVLSPGGVELAPGPDPNKEQDDLTLIFTVPVQAFGFDHLSQSADGISFTSISVFNSADTIRRI